MQLRQLLEWSGIDVPRLVQGAVAKVPVLSLAGQLSLGTVLGRKTINVSIPTEGMQLFGIDTLHAKPLCQAQMTSAKLRAAAGIAGDAPGGFTVISHPFPANNRDNLWQTIWLAFFAVLFTLVPFCYNPACYAMHAVGERTSSVKHMLFISGMGYETYWAANLCFDYLCYFLVAIWAMFCFSVSGAIDFSTDRSTVALSTTMLFALYGLAAIPQAYCLSFCFKQEATAQIAISMFNFITGWLFVVGAVSLDVYGLTELGDQLRIFFRFFPAFNLGEALIVTTRACLTKKLVGKDLPDVMQWGLTGRNLVILTVLSLFYFAVLVLIEFMCGSVRLNKYGNKVARSLTKVWRSRPVSKTTITPLAVRGQDAALESIMPAAEVQFSDDEGEPEPGLIVYGKKPTQHGPGEGPEQGVDGDARDLTELKEDELMGGRETLIKTVDGGVLRRIGDVGGGANGFEFEPDGSRRRGASARKANTYVFDEDEDVRAERRRLLRSVGEDTLQIMGVRKVYAEVLTGKKFVAVRHLSLGVKRGECFGLLGTNGAGKTTLAKMVTRDVFPSEGKILLGGTSIFTAGSRLIGYCPQFDALVDLLTAREHLTMFANVKGLPGERIAGVVDKLLENCDIAKHADSYAMTYSGGTKRKLSLAIALLGRPKLVLLDEPSAGVDPSARRKIWEIICASLNDGRSIMLTTHSMEEAEALCDRLCIMANGVMRCVGSSGHLKERFSAGFEVHLRAESRQDCFNAIGYLQGVFKNATLKEQYGPQAKLSVPSKGTSLAAIFSALEQNRKAWRIESYGVTQSSLEQVFMNIAEKFNPALKGGALRSSTSKGGSGGSSEGSGSGGSTSDMRSKKNKSDSSSSSSGHDSKPNNIKTNNNAGETSLLRAISFKQNK
jgi:ABC-type multidrug transport system ATPase subunit